MRRMLAVLTSFVLAGAAQPASAGNLDLRVGGFFPRADTGSANDLFVDDSVLYTVGKSDWDGWTGGLQYNTRIARNVELGFNVDWYGKKNHTAYREYVRPNGREITQTLDFYTVPFGATLRFVAGGRRAKVAPFAGVGGGAVYWRYEEYGEFIDFDRPATLPVLEDSFISEGTSPEFHVVGGIRFALNDDVGMVAEGRYQWATADMGQDFRGNRIDLTGFSVTLGVNIRF